MNKRTKLGQTQDAFAYAPYDNAAPLRRAHRPRRKKAALGTIAALVVAMSIAAATTATLLRTRELALSVTRERSLAYIPYFRREEPDEVPMGPVDEIAAPAARTDSSGRSLRSKDDVSAGALPSTSEQDGYGVPYVATRSVGGATQQQTADSLLPRGFRVELLDWFTKGTRAFPRGQKATVIDIETGLAFDVRRFGGSYHADSYPLTKADTAIMKRAYGGEWSWSRRAIWVIVGNRVIAASMNGMPHMVDPNHKDDFEGHFCIHLYKSKVHQTGNECAVHQSMVMKAFLAGKNPRKLAPLVK